ncbi:MAG: hypothetical protein WCF04_01105 [Candidatus Nanopelagicales bacterium]
MSSTVGQPLKARAQLMIPMRLGLVAQQLVPSRHTDVLTVGRRAATRPAAIPGARDARPRYGFAHPPLSAMPVEYLTPAIEDRAVEDQLLSRVRARTACLREFPA